MIYLDHNATTNIHPSAVSAMEEWRERPLNASSVHSYGRIGKSILENARKHLAPILGLEYMLSEYNIIFTATGTEANNIILGNFRNNDAEIFISESEHPSIWMNKSANIKHIKVLNDGGVDLEDLDRKLSTSKAPKKLVSIMHANNETGVVNDLYAVVEIARKHNALIHSDMVQSIGKIAVDIADMDLDFASISGHKFGGPVGAAALIAKAKHHIEPIFFGGGQEKGARPGTENVVAISGFGAAALVLPQELDMRISHMQKLHDKLEQELLSNIDGLVIASKNARHRLPNTSLVMNPNMESSTQLIALDMENVAASAGSACSSGKVKKSYVLEAMGYDDSHINSALRLSLGYTSTEQDVNKFIEIYKKINR